MNKFITALCLGIILNVCAFAQTDPADEYEKNEYYVGYSNQQSDNFGSRSSNGVEAAYVRNVSRYFGIKGDFSGVFQKNRIRSFGETNGGTTSFSYDITNSRYNFLGGVQIKDNASNARFKPFAHLLAGVAVNHSKLKNFSCTGTNCSTFIIAPQSFTNTNFSAAIGGGLDIKINKRVDFRAFQVDYNPSFGSGFRQNNIRLGVGFVFK